MRLVRLFAFVSCLWSSAGLAADIDIAALPPGCLEPWQRVLTLASTLVAPVQAQGGTFTVVASGPDAVARAGFVVFPDVDVGAAPAAVQGIPDDLVADGEVDIVETPFEVVVVLRPVEGLDLLGSLVDGAAKSGGRFPDLVRRRVPLWRGRGVQALQLGDVVDAASLLPGGTLREVAARFGISRDGTTGVVVAISRSLGGAARVERALAAQPPQILLHAGGTRGDACANALLTLGVAALVPRTSDLVAASSLTPSSSFAALPFVAANLVDGSGASPWPRFRAFTVEGVRVAVIGLVGSGQLVRSPADVRARLRVTSGRDAVADVVAALRKESDGPPDLVIALSSGDGAERAQLSAVDGLDVVVGDFSRDDGLPVTQHVSPQLSREYARHDALVAPVFHRAGLGRVVAEFVTGAARPALTAVRVDVDPLLDDRRMTSVSSKLAAPLRHDEDERAARGAPVLLPAVARLAAVPAASPLVWGDRVALLGEVRRRAPHDPPLWTDDLLLRVLGNVVVDATGVDAAVLRNVVHGSLMAGPLSRATVESWLDTSGDVVFVDITGAELLRVVERIAALPPSFDDASDKIAVSGIDIVRRVARARPIEPLASYRLAIDERLAGDPRFAGLLDRVVAGASHRSLVGIVVDHLSEVHTDDARLVADLSGDRVGEWRVGVQGLELRGSAVRTSENLAALAASGESRAATRHRPTFGPRAVVRDVGQPGFRLQQRVAAPIRRHRVHRRRPRAAHRRAI
jgi:hypothetical protein